MRDHDQPEMSDLAEADPDHVAGGVHGSTVPNDAVRERGVHGSAQPNSGIKGSSRPDAGRKR